MQRCKAIVLGIHYKCYVFLFHISWPCTVSPHYSDPIFLQMCLLAKHYLQPQHQYSQCPQCLHGHLWLCANWQNFEFPNVRVSCWSETGQVSWTSIPSWPMQCCFFLFSLFFCFRLVILLFTVASKQSFGRLSRFLSTRKLWSAFRKKYFLFFFLKAGK